MTRPFICSRESGWRVSCRLSDGRCFGWSIVSAPLGSRGVMICAAGVLEQNVEGGSEGVLAEGTEVQRE